MTTAKTTGYGFIVFLLAAAMIGCPGPSSKAMIPELAAIKGISTAKTLNISAVEGGRKPEFGGMETLTDETFQKAILSTFRASGIFKEIGAGIDADYHLFAEITSMDTVTDQAATYTTFLVVNYRLFRSGHQRELWQKIIRSLHRVTVAQAVSGGARMTRALEGATRKNLARLVDEIARIPSL